jgi:hypothetical protein
MNQARDGPKHATQLIEVKSRSICVAFVLGFLIRKRASGGSPPPRLFALDCEMVETDVESKSLVGLCVVDEDGNAVYKVRQRQGS